MYNIIYINYLSIHFLGRRIREETNTLDLFPVTSDYEKAIEISISTQSAEGTEVPGGLCDPSS